MKIKSGMHVVVLMGGLSSERDVSLQSGKNCIRALKENNFKVTPLDFNESSILDLINLKPDVCFNSLHGAYGEDGNIQGLLNILKIPYTHSGVLASAIAMNKIYFKELITKKTKNSNLPIFFPKTLDIDEGKVLSVKNYNKPYVIKPVSGGSSIGVSLIMNKHEAPLKKNWPTNINLMAEKLVGTRELTVTVLKDKALCVTEIKPSEDYEFYDYSSKYIKYGSAHQLPAIIPNNITKQSMDWAVKAHKIINCKGISRSDFRYDPDENKLFMLEINTQPGMTETSLAPEQALFCNIDMPKMVKILIEEASFE